MEHEAESAGTEAEPGGTEATGQDASDDRIASGAVADRVAAKAPAEQMTGEPRVDAALKLLERLPGLPVSDHPELFEQVHARLSEVLDELESGSGGAGPVGR